MNEEGHKVFLSLTGGLGNQLFQLAAGMNLARNRKLTLITELGSPRKSKTGNADLLSFSLPEGIEVFNPKRANWITRKTAGFMLRSGFEPTRLEKNFVFTFFSKLFANTVMTIFLGSRVMVLASDNIGFSQIHLTKHRVLLFGYFQSYRWAENPQILRSLRSITYSRTSELIEQYAKDAEIELPLIVHVRLGDYLSEKNFGIPSKDYYSRGINKLLVSEKYKSIWIFSDDLEKAREFIPKDISIPIRMIPEIENSAAATLEVMRFGIGYVIANSTFSWWGAFLAKRPNVEVVAPEPWFRGMDEPTDLIPSTWKRIDADYQQSTP